MGHVLEKYSYTVFQYNVWKPEVSSPRIATCLIGGAMNVVDTLVCPRGLSVQVAKVVTPSVPGNRYQATSNS